MIKNIDHMTIAVTHLEAAKEFFRLLNFVVTHEVVIENEPFAKYMNIADIKADHVSMVLYHGDKEAQPRFEIQLLHFYRPEPQQDATIHRLDKHGYNHLCFAVDDIQKEIEKLERNNVKILSDLLDFNDRILVYFEGPDGIILELAQWKAPAGH
jgi:catechol 2,3-dioxygenase-like lactoylglutathione lyase family enzyme